LQMSPLLPMSTLLPYTTLFRSTYGYRTPLGGNAIDTVMQVIQVRRLVASADTTFQCPAVGRVPHQVSPRADVPAKTFVIVVTHRSEEHTSELQSRENLVCRLLP